MLLHLAGRTQELTASSLTECKRKEMLSHSLEFGAQDLVWEEEIKEGRKKIVWEELTEAKRDFI